MNVETTLCMSTLKFASLNNVESMLSISKFILTTSGNVETMFVIFNVEFHNIGQRRSNVVNMTIFKKLKRAKKYFRETWNVQCKNKRWKVYCTVHENNMKITV